MEGKTLDEQFNDLLNHPLGKRIAEIHIMYAKPAYRNDVWPTYDDYMKKFVIRQIKGIIEKVRIWERKVSTLSTRISIRLVIGIIRGQIARN